jgi:hypothetical protein
LLYCLSVTASHILMCAVSGAGAGRQCRRFFIVSLLQA